jgi:imidazolonepropionase-like amidohydrolase
MPGLFDMHTHNASPTALMAYGVTSVRRLGGEFFQRNQEADRSETTDTPLPRYFFSGPHITDRRLGVEDAPSRVRRFKEQGAQFIKIHWPYSWRLQRAVADEARRQGLPVVGHGMSVEEVTKSVTLGFWTLEHGPGDKYDDVLGLMATAGTRLVPTFAVAYGAYGLLRREPELLADAKVRAFFSETRIRRGNARMFWGLSDDAFRGRWVERLERMRRGYDLGLQLLAGTDAPLYGAFSGVSLHWELRFLVEAGLPPLEVLRIATEEAAITLGLQDDLGTLEVGKLADIVLLNANPLEDIKNTQTIWRVIKGGFVFDPDELRPERN